MPTAPKFDSTKSGLIDAIAAAAGITKVQAKAAYEAVVQVAYKGAKAKEGYTLPGLCKFVIGERKARSGINPLTKEKIKIPKSKILKVKVVKAAKDAVLGKKK